MSTTVKKPRKGSLRWLAWQVASGAELTAHRVNSALPWHYTLKTKDEAGIKEHSISASTIASLTEKRVLTANLESFGEYAWNRITYTPGPNCDHFCDTED